MSIRTNTAAGSTIAGTGLLPMTGVPAATLGLVATLGLALMSIGAAIWHATREQ